MKKIVKILMLITCLTTSLLAQESEKPESYIGAKAKKVLYKYPKTFNYMFMNGECIDTKQYVTKFNYEEDPAFTKKIKTNEEAIDFIVKRESVTKLEANYFFDKMYLILKYQDTSKEEGMVSVIEFFEMKEACKLIKKIQ